MKPLLPQADRLPGPAALAASRGVQLYHRWSPVARGKFRLWRFAADRFLVSTLKAGPRVRTSGLSGCEWTMFAEGVKEPISTDVMRALLTPGMTVIDAGAHVGYFSLIAASLGAGCVYAFEPTPKLAARVRTNAALNGFSQVIVEETALSNAEGQATFHLSDVDPEANGLANGSDVQGSTITVRTTTLDAYAAAASIGRVDFIKMDCEGAEFDALTGARGLLGSPHAPMLLVEWNPETLNSRGRSPEELHALLVSHSYNCVAVERLSTRGPVWNVLAFKPSHDAAACLARRMNLQPIA